MITFGRIPFVDDTPDETGDEPIPYTLATADTPEDN